MARLSVWSYISRLFEKFKRNKERQMIYEVLSDSRAMFSSLGKDIYFSDFVNNCLDRIAVEISKIEVVSVLQKQNSVERLRDDITRLFEYQPNPLQTTKDFLSCCSWLVRKQMNCFIYGEYEIVTSKQGKKYKKYKAFYPLNPQSAEIGHFEDGRYAIKFYFKDGTNYTLPYEEIIHLKWRRGTSTLIGGGDDNGQVDTQSVMRSLTVLDDLMQGLPKMVQSSLGINGILTAKTLADGKLLEQKRDEFEEHIHKSASGLVAIDLATDFVPIQQKYPDVPENVLKFAKSVIRERYGISEAILSGDYNAEQHAAFYQNCVEDFIIEFEQAMSAKIFTARERDCGHRIRAYYSKVAYLDVKEKRNLAALGRDAGILTLNEIRELYGLSPIPEGNRRLQSLNYVSTEIIDEYQKGQVANNKSKKSDDAKNDENLLDVSIVSIDEGSDE